MARDQEARGQNRHPKRTETQAAQSRLQAMQDSSVHGGGCALARIFKFVKRCGELAQVNCYWLSIPGRPQLFLCPVAFKNYRMTSVQGIQAVNLEPPEWEPSPSLAERENERNRGSQIAIRKNFRFPSLGWKCRENLSYMTAPSIHGTNSSAPNP